MVHSRFLVLFTAFASLIAAPMVRAQTAPADTPQQPSMEAPEVHEAAPSDTSTQPPAGQLQLPPSDNSAQPSNPVEEQQEESTSEPEKQAEGHKHKEDRRKALTRNATANPVIWEMPENIAGKDLFWGQGGEQRQPKPPFKFVEEDFHGTNPKFDARDADGKKWRVKLGAESRPEVVASRLLWAVGYFANDDYVIPSAEIRGLKMKRKSENQRGTEVIDARFARKPGGRKKIGVWSWKDNPVFGTREFNGLRVMMALLNNWDLKDENNAIQADDKNSRQIFLCSDVGASFGGNGMRWTRSDSEGDVNSYKASKFILRNSGTGIDFATPAPPKAILVESAGMSSLRFLKRAKLDWIGKNIPNPDAHWIGSLLGQLTHQQLLDAFRAGNFPPEQIEVYVSVLESRIAELKGI
jgi:hypothetical protein